MKQEMDIVPGGPSREEVGELNRLKQSKPKSKIPERVANVVAASLTALYLTSLL